MAEWVSTAGMGSRVESSMLCCVALSVSLSVRYVRVCVCVCVVVCDGHCWDGLESWFQYVLLCANKYVGCVCVYPGGAVAGGPGLTVEWMGTAGMS